MNDFAIAITPDQRQMLERLRASIRELGAAAVCFSGGVDSTLLLAVAHEQLGENVLAVTEVNALYPARESEEAAAFCRQRGIQQQVIDHDPCGTEALEKNPRNRCYFCKKELFGHVQRAADAWAQQRGLLGTACVCAADGAVAGNDAAAGNGDAVEDRGIATEDGGTVFAAHIPLLEGSNVSDRADYRPGAQAVKEHGALSPLDAAGMTKQDVRDISRALGLPTWEKPSFACLASRFVYGEAITAELLARVDAAEQLLLDAGFLQVRVRVHDRGALARVEVPSEQVPQAFAFMAAEGAACLHDLGFTHVSLDMDGYRTGSMNE